MSAKWRDAICRNIWWIQAASYELWAMSHVIKSCISYELAYYYISQRIEIRQHEFAPRSSFSQETTLLEYTAAFFLSGIWINHGFNLSLFIRVGHVFNRWLSHLGACTRHVFFSELNQLRDNYIPVAPSIQSSPGPGFSYFPDAFWHIGVFRFSVVNNVADEMHEVGALFPCPSKEWFLVFSM